MAQFAGRVEAQIKVPTGGSSVSVGSGASATAQTVTVPAASYYYTQAGGVSSITTVLQTLINAALSPYPDNATSVQAGLGYGTWAAGWMMNETSGSLAAIFGSPSLTAGGTPTYATAGPTSVTGDYAVGFDTNTEYFDGGNNYNVTTNDLCVAWVAKFSAAPDGNSFIGKGAGANGWWVLSSASGLYLHTYDGTTTADTAVVSAYVGEWHVGVACIDRSTGKLRIATYGLTSRTSSVSAEVTAPANTLTNASSLRLGATGGGGTANTDCLYSAMYINTGSSIATGMSANLTTVVTNLGGAIGSTFSVSLSTSAATGLVTLSNSFWPCYLQFSDTNLRDMLGFAYNFDYPQTAAQMATALGYGNWTSGVGWLCNEASGSLSTVFGSPALSASSTPTYSNIGARGGVDKSVGFDSVSDSFAGGAADLDVSATEDLIVVWVAHLASDIVAGNLNDIFRKLSGSGYRLYMYRNSGSSCGIAFQNSDGVNNAYALTDNASAALNIGSWHVGIAVTDRGANQNRVATYNLTTGVSTVGTATSLASVGSMSNAGSLTVGINVSQPWQLAALYAVKGSGVASGLSANLGTAIASLGAYMKSQTSTQSARGIWFPDCPLNLDGDPKRAPLVSDLRQTVGPTGQVLGLVGNTFKRHKNVTWSHVPIARVWDAEATYENGSWEEFFSETQMAQGSSWFTASNLIQIYDHNGNQVGVDASVAGWYVLGVNSIEPTKSTQDWTGLWRISLPTIVAVGS